MEFKHKSVLLYAVSYTLMELLAEADIHTKSLKDFPGVED